MLCPYCHSDQTKVIDSRETELGSTRRRRECLKCSKRYTTYERVEEIELTVVKKNKNRERFDRNKLIKGIMRACEKRPIKIEKIERIVDEIETELRKKDSIEIPSTDIGEMVMDKLGALDKIAYIRFASVYREFTDLKSFENELKKIKKG